MPSHLGYLLFSLALTSVAVTGCAANTTDDDDQAQLEGAATATAEIRSLNGHELEFTLRSLPYAKAGEPGFAAIRSEGSKLAITSIAYRLHAGPQTLVPVNASGNTNALSREGVPRNVVAGATLRLVLFRMGEARAEPLVDSVSGLNLFERITIEGDSAVFTTVTSDGKRVTGRIMLPGLSDPLRSPYLFSVVPRNVARGSLLGTHFFEVRGPARPPIDDIAD